MARWEERFREWAKPPSDAEEQRCENTIKYVREAVAASPALAKRDVRAFVQGSYRNNTNIPGESDVDIGVGCFDSFFYELPHGTEPANFGFNAPAAYQYATFKADLGSALATYFGEASVKRGNKAFDVKEGTRSVEADVTPFFERRIYSVQESYVSGYGLFPDDKSGVIGNWPEQHYDNGVDKNNETGRRYKSMVRIMKSLKCHMVSEGVAVSPNVIGFLIECLLYNVPNENFIDADYEAAFKNAVLYAEYMTAAEQSCASCVEVSGRKYLFAENQKWTRADAFGFLVQVKKFTGLF